MGEPLSVRATGGGWVTTDLEPISPILATTALPTGQGWSNPASSGLSGSEGSDPVEAGHRVVGSDPLGAGRGSAGNRDKRLWVLNLLLFQLGWWALVLSAAQGRPLIGLAVVALILAWHLGFVRPLASEALLIGLAALMGLVFDGILLNAGWVSFGPPDPVAVQATALAAAPAVEENANLAAPASALAMTSVVALAASPDLTNTSTASTSTVASLAAALPPVWMIALWANFATTLNLSLAGLQSRPGLAALLGLVGGPLAYWGGAGLGAMTFVAPLPALITLALGWALLTPLLLALAATLARRSNP